MQSGSKEVLKRMNRKYDNEYLIEVCKNIKEVFKNATISVDVIVGFPEETDKEFEETVKTIEKMGLMKLHVFKYSKRSFTVAARMQGQVDGNVKKQRSNKLIKISNKCTKDVLSEYLGKT